MTDATEHAIEQAERIVQYAKYSDRFMVVEGDSVAERRAFVKLIGQKLPRQVRPVVMRADAGNGADTLIEQLSTLLQLSAGIESTGQLITAATAALEGQDRLLIVIENADQWLGSESSDALYDLINQAHDQARERILFLLVGSAGLCERVETAQPLAGLIADLHCAKLLGHAHTESAAAATAAAPSPSQAATTPPVGQAPDPATAQPTTSGRRPIWSNPTVLVGTVVGIAVITAGVFVLLSRSEGPSQPAPTGAITASSEENQAATMQGEGENQQTRLAAKEDAPSADANEQPATRPAEEKLEALEPYALPPHIPFPPETEQEASQPSTEMASAASTPETSASTTEEEPTPAAADTRSTTVNAQDAEVENPWFADQPRARAVIQLAAFGTLDGARQMIERFANQDLPAAEWRVYTQTIDGKKLYTVTFGDYASSERARHAIDPLPDNLQALEPYPRSVGTIQDRIAGE